MFKFTRKNAVVAGATAMAIAAGGTAWAYFTATGSVFGSATVDDPTIYVNAVSMSAPISGLDVPVPVDVTLKATDASVNITSLTLSLDTTDPFWSTHAGGDAKCLAEWFDVTPAASVTFPATTVTSDAAGTEIPGTVSGLQIMLKNVAEAQNGCLGQQIPLSVDYH